ncbi:MAG: glycosyltransferase family 2 protein [Sulfurospirillaceae bacterium]|nr:glycosyltransferase family 2 protein [Sulfurospirillaceae bacterium]
MSNKITVTILAKNSQKYIQECLSALVRFDEIILLDNGSEDATIEIAKEFKNVKVYESKFIGFGPLKNLALSYATNDWILSVDSDEILNDALVDEILNLHLSNNKIYSILRDNYYNKKLIKCCGWEDDFVLRLFNKNITKFNDKQVHESIMINPQVEIVKLKNSFKHYSFDSAQELIEKMQKYSTLYAKEHKNQKSSSPAKAFFRAFFMFFKNYIFQKGFLYGYAGLLISTSNANGVFYKYIKLYEENKK